MTGALSTGRRRITRGSGASLLLLVLLCGLQTGCNSPRRGRPIGSSGASSAETAARAAKDRSVILWSSAVNYHGVDVRFELPPGTASSAARFERTEFGDRLLAHGLALSHRYHRFETAGGGRCHFEPNSRVFVFRPPSPDEPWSTVGDRFSFSWLGNGTTPVVREDRRDGSVRWTFRRTTLTLEVDRTVTYSRRDETESFPTPVSLVLGKTGEILEKRASLR